MKRYFVNPEIKISSTIIISIIALFFAITAIVLKLNYDSLKKDYTKSIGAIALRVIEKDPQLENEIMPLILQKTTDEEAERGKVFLQQYGFNENLETSLFPYMKETASNNTYSIIIIFSFLGVLLFIINYCQYGFFYNKIRKLTLAANKVIEGEYDISLSETMEGDLSKLSIAFNSMRDVIRNNIYELKAEKQFLVDLLSDISHQLKTPLSSLIVYTDIMLSKELSKDQRDTFLLNDKKQLYKMNWLIKNLLKLAKLDAKAISLNKEEQSLNETIQESIDTLQSKGFQEKVQINFDEKDEVISSHDRLWLQEAINNIIKNGIEHTPGGVINIELEENPLYRRIIVKDNGEGIGEEDLPHIFKRFYKAKTSKNNDSIGIGLALSKSIIEAHNGTIEVESQLEVGTKFIITFLKY